VTATVVGVWTILMPASGLPHRFGYFAAVAAFLLGVRFGARAVPMLAVCCVAIGIAEIAGRGVCTPNSNSLKCGFEAAAPFLIFGYFLIPTIAGAMLGGVGRAWRLVLRDSRRAGLRAPRDGGELRVARTVVVAVGGAAVTFVAFALLPFSGAPLFLPSVAACVVLGLAPSYGAASPSDLAIRPRAPTW
jgi:hypothetical protein